VITAVDSNILLDVLGADPEFGEPSSEALRRCRRDGSLVASEVVFAETATAFGDAQGFLAAMGKLSISFAPMTEVAALKAADFWRQYRKAGGPRVRIASDFLIGAHALVTADRLLTRDRGFFRRYFAGLRVVDPSEGR
jgi:predicted nucleic acid-binding protein